jgi:acyl-CoA synthetase (AMP-forming)/AMP-acid ligase II
MQAIGYFDRGARLRPDAVAFCKDGQGVTYAEAADITHRIAAALACAGIGAGSKVAVYSPNRIDAFLAVLGILRGGAVWVPINVRNGLAENTEILARSDCEALFYHGDFEAVLTDIRASVPGLKLVVRLDAPGTQAPALQDWMMPAGTRFPALPADPDRLSAILSTGGTTGRPKGVMWRDLTWESMAANFWAHMPSSEPPVYLVAAPMTHAAGVIAVPLMAAGARIVILDHAEPLAVMQAIERERVTHLFLPPTVIYMMLAHPQVRAFDYSSLRYFIYSAAPMAATKVSEAMEIFGPVMTQAYGQAEVPLMGTFLGPAEHVEILAGNRLERLKSCGRPCLFTELEILDDDGNILPPGEKGEIAFRGNLVMAGYYKDEAATAEAWRGGWHHTGDIGYRDEDGFVYIVDRKKDMIITGGFNVYSAEVEQVILAHPAVQDCAVIGAPDDKWGEIVKAVIEVKQGVKLEPEDIVAHCRETLGGVKTPKSVEIWADLPRSPVGKVLKRAIRDRYWAGRDRAV